MKNKGVSAIIGVILMVAITVAIAATVYVYVENLMQEQEEEPELYVEGTVLFVENLGTSPTLNTTVYNITLDDGNSYSMLFRTEEAVVPPAGVTLRFYYEIVLSDYYDVYKIKSL